MGDRELGREARLRVFFGGCANAEVYHVSLFNQKNNASRIDRDLRFHNSIISRLRPNFLHILSTPATLTPTPPP